MAWVNYQCHLCRGEGQLDIGRNEDGRFEYISSCPCCNGSGWLDIFRIYYSQPHKRLKW